MDAREESEWYQRDYEHGQFDARLAGHGDILMPGELEAWKEHWQEADRLKDARNRISGGLTP